MTLDVSEQPKATRRGTRAEARRATRDEIIAAAGVLFAETGFQKTNVGDIAAAVGMSPANLYRHFRNKRAIGQAVIEAYVLEEAAESRAAREREHPSHEARLRAVITATTTFITQHLRQAPRLVELAAMLYESEEGLALIERQLGLMLTQYEELLTAGFETGEFVLPPGIEAPADAARALHHAVSYFHSPDDIARHGLDRVERDLEITLDLVFAGFRARPSQA